MTLLPVEPRRLGVVADGVMPAYEWRGQCRIPHCEEPATDPHHIVRRSAGGGVWVRIDEQPVPNVAGVCRYHHDRLTEGASMIRWNARWEWIPDVGLDPDAVREPLRPLAPKQGARRGAHCPTCGRAWPQPKPFVTAPGARRRRRRRILALSVPNDGEDGAAVIETLAGAVGEVIYGEAGPEIHYFAIAAALAYAVQHQDDIIRQLEEGRDHADTDTGA